MTLRPLTRIGLLILAVGQLSTGFWAVLAPHHWFMTFPPGRPGWVAAHEPFNHHLALDAGTGFLATGTALMVAAIWPYRQVVLVAIITYLAHAVPHLVFHLTHPATDLPIIDQTLEWLTVAGGIVVAVWVAWSVLKTSRPAVASTDGGEVDGAAVVLPERPKNLLSLVLFGVARWRMGVVPDSWRALGRVPVVLFGRACGDAVHAHTRHVPESLAVIATLRAATLVECEFCIDINSSIAAKQEVSERKVRDLARWSESSAFDETEQLALELTDLMTATPATVPNDLVQQLCNELGEPALIELAAIIGHENARARANVAMGVPPQGFAVAESCATPERGEAGR